MQQGPGRRSAIGRYATGLLAAASPLLGPLFTGDAEVRDLLVPVLVVAAIGQPVAGVVFVLDGVLIGAGDGRYLARAGLVAIWVSFAAVFMGARFVVLVHRARGDAWLVTGARRVAP